MSSDWSDSSSSGWSSGWPSPLEPGPLGPLEPAAGPGEPPSTGAVINANGQFCPGQKLVSADHDAKQGAALLARGPTTVAAGLALAVTELPPAPPPAEQPAISSATQATDTQPAGDPDTPHAAVLEAPLQQLEAPLPAGGAAAGELEQQGSEGEEKGAHYEQPAAQPSEEPLAAAEAAPAAAAETAVHGSQCTAAASSLLDPSAGQPANEQQNSQQPLPLAEGAVGAGGAAEAAAGGSHAPVAATTRAEPADLSTECEPPAAALGVQSLEVPELRDTTAAAAVQPEAGVAGGSEAAPTGQDAAEPAAAPGDATVLVAARRSTDREGMPQGMQPQPKEWQLAPLALPPPPGPPLATYPVQQLQAVLGSGLVGMRQRLTAAAHRESALRLETVDAAVEREALAQACAFAEAALEGERTARLAAEQELGLLAAAAEEEQRQWEERFAEGQEQLRAARSAVRALERKLSALQSELDGERSRRVAAEEGAARLQRELEEQQKQAAAAAALAQQRERDLQREREQWEAQEAAAAPRGTSTSAAVKAHPGGGSMHGAGGPPATSSGTTDAVLLHHVLKLQEDVVAIKGHAQQAQQAQQQAQQLPIPAPLQQQQQQQQAPCQPAVPPAPACSQGWQGWVGSAPPPQLPQWHSPPPPLPTLGRPQSTAAEAQGMGSPSRPATARPLLAEVRSWLQQQQYQYQQQEQAAREQEEELMEQMLQAAAAGALGQSGGQPGLQYAPGPWWGGPPPAAAQQWQGSPARRPLHEPRPPVQAPAAGAKRRQVAVRPASRWDYRPAWNEGLRVDDLPLSSRARQAGTAAEPGSAQPQPQVSPAAPAAWAAVQAPTLQQPAVPAQGIIQPPQAQQAQQQAGVPPGPPQAPQLQQQVPSYQTAQGPPPPTLPPSAAAPFNNAFNAAVQQCYMTASPTAMPLGPSPPAQWQQQLQPGWPAAADPLSRPVTAGVQQWQVTPHQVVASTPQPPQQVYAEAPVWAGYGQPVAQPMVQQQPVPQTYQHPSGMPFQQQQQQQHTRPATPGAGLGLGLGGSSDMGSAAHTAWQPQTASAINTARPRSAAAKDKPLAVAPTQVDEAALAAARAEYIRETARIRAKRLREMQESADFRL